MRLELHILQNFAPSNLNRDDTGSPKDCEFGGFRRARISSQAIKRAVRRAFESEDLLPEEDRAVRTKRITGEVGKRLAAGGRDAALAPAVAEAALGALGLTVGEDGKTQYLLYLGGREITRLATFCDENWDTLAGLVRDAEQKKAKDAKKAAREAAKTALPGAAKELKAALDGGRAADLALFGRMLADLPDNNVDAACQVAHALSTNRVSMEFDYYTAVDDLKPDDTAGADMIGTVEFNSACFYRYTNLDLGQLKENLDDDAGIVRSAIEAFVRASITAIPTGKQNSMAAQNLPGLVFAVVREGGPWNLANAFLHPVRPDAAGDLEEVSAKELSKYWEKLSAMYGRDDVRAAFLATYVDGEFTGALDGYRVANVGELVHGVIEAVA